MWPGILSLIGFFFFATVVEAEWHSPEYDENIFIFSVIMTAVCLFLTLYFLVPVLF